MTDTNPFSDVDGVWLERGELRNVLVAYGPRRASGESLDDIVSTVIRQRQESGHNHPAVTALVTLAEQLQEEARERDWCRDYDRFVKRVNTELGRPVLRFMKDRPKPVREETPDTKIDRELITQLVGEMGVGRTVYYIAQEYVRRAGLNPERETQRYIITEPEDDGDTKRSHKLRTTGPVTFRLMWWPYSNATEDEMEEADDDQWVVLDTITLSFAVSVTVVES